MRITHHWLREFTRVDASPAELARRLTLAGLEVEAVVPVAPPFSGVVVGEVLVAGRHPNAEKLSLCEVTTNGADRLQIICGAPNVRAGLKVAVATVGAHLPGDVVIKRAKLRGIESNGMLCSSRELGLGTEHDGIMELAASLPIGTDVRIALDLDDASLEVNATPNRGDCMSVFGIARDYAAAHDARYLEYAARTIAAVGNDTVPVRIVASRGCPIFGSRIVRGVKTAEQSPGWLRERLRRVGINSISAIVDVTNYVMMELGQPMHAYDLAKLSGGITVRMADAEEKIKLLNDQEYVLDERFLVIADGNGPIGLGGVMGGGESAISADTADVLLEAAHFSPDVIAGRARQLGLFTDAAQRFERGVDPKLPAQALERATELLLQIAGGQPGPVQLTRAEGTESLFAPPAVTLRSRRLAKLLGADIPAAEVQALLGHVIGQVETLAEGWRVIPPTHRFDIRIEADLIEEVARLRGFDSIAERHASAPQIAGDATESRVENERLLNAMIDAGYREAITYTFVDPALQRQLFPDEPAFALANAISADLSEMRVSLWPGLVQAARDNLRRQQTRVRLFEIGKKFSLRSMTGEKSASLREIETLAGIATGARVPEQWGSARETLDFFDMKADVTKLFSFTGDPRAFRFEPETLGCLRPGRTARIYRDTTPVGWIGELHPQLVRALGLPLSPIIFEIETDLAFTAKPSKFIRISRFPSVRRDISVVVDENVPLAVLQENVTVSASGLLSELRVFDIYRGPGVESSRKSVALGLILQDSSRTLTDDDADAVMASVVARLRDVLSASIRDQ